MFSENKGPNRNPQILGLLYIKDPERDIANYYLLKNPKKTKDNSPYIPLVRKNSLLCFLGGVLEQLVVNPHMCQAAKSSSSKTGGGTQHAIAVYAEEDACDLWGFFDLRGYLRLTFLGS